MLNLILFVLGAAIIITGVAFVFVKEKLSYLLLSLLGIVPIILGGSFVDVPSGYVGIKTVYGQISDETINSGFNFKVPIVERIHLVNCKQTEKNYGDLQIWSETSERTEVYCQNVVVDYQINAEYAAWIWQNVEEYDNNLVKQTSIESGIKAATKKFNDADVTDRSKIEVAAKETIQNSLNEKYGNQVVNVVWVSIGNMNFSDAYNEAIEKRAQARLAAETAEYSNTQQTQQVQAQAEQKRIQAQADADAILLRAEAEAEANAKIAESLTPELIELEKIKRWNGVLPTVVGSTEQIVDISDLLNEGEG